MNIGPAVAAFFEVENRNWAKLIPPPMGLEGKCKLGLWAQSNTISHFLFFLLPLLFIIIAENKCRCQPNKNSRWRSRIDETPSPLSLSYPAPPFSISLYPWRTTPIGVT